jgi:hypothetical protein
VEDGRRSGRAHSVAAGRRAAQTGDLS